LPARSATDADDDVQGLGKEARDHTQPAHRPFVGELAGAAIGQHREIGLDEPRFDLAAIDETQILHRSLGCLCHRDQPRHAAIAAAGAWRAFDRARNRAGDDPADLEKAAAGRRGADPEEARLGIASGAREQGGKKQTGAGEAAPAMR
jgi:hypothetical protein